MGSRSPTAEANAAQQAAAAAAQEHEQRQREHELNASSPSPSLPPRIPILGGGVNSSNASPSSSSSSSPSTSTPPLRQRGVAEKAATAAIVTAVEAESHQKQPDPQTSNPFAPGTSATLPPDVSTLTAIRRSFAQPVFASFLAGGVAGAVSRTVVSPLERLKILFQVQSAGRTEYKLSVGKALGKMWKEEGFAGFMRGNGTNCIRIIPYSAVQFGSYNLYKRFFEDQNVQDMGGMSPLHRLICGGLAGITSVVCTYPLDIVRTRLSIQSASFADLRTDREMSQKLPGMWATLIKMYQTEGGWLALYRGMIPTVAGVAPYVGLNFMVYEWARQYVTPEGQKNPSAVGKLAAGAISGAVAQTCTYPFDVLRRRFQINTMSGMGYQYKGIFDAIRIIVTQEGLRGLYKGIVPNLLKVAPSMASSWLSFEFARDTLLTFGRMED